MTRLKELESRFREKYNFPHNETTIGTPSESLLIGNLMVAIAEESKHRASYIALKYVFDKNPRLKNLTALLWKGCQKEADCYPQSFRFSTKYTAAKNAMARGLLSGRYKFDIENKAIALLQEMAKILPAINDLELAAIRERHGQIDEMVQQVARRVKRRLEKGISIFEEYDDEADSETDTRVKRCRV